MKHQSQTILAQFDGENRFTFSTDRRACVVEVSADHGGVIAEIRVGNQVLLHMDDRLALVFDLSNIRFPSEGMLVEANRQVGIRMLDMAPEAPLRVTFESLEEEYPDPPPPEEEHENGESSEESLEALETDLETEAGDTEPPPASPED